MKTNLKMLAKIHLVARKGKHVVGKMVSSGMAFVMAISLFAVSAYAEPNESPTENARYECRSAILMEAETGTVLYEQNPDEALPPASVTKIMTLLLVMEAIENGKIRYTDMVTASANACSMGGSQIYLKEGEQMSVEDMIKSVVIASANDAAVALAEYIAGTEESFVAMMNARAKELGMLHTHFENTNGLDDTTSDHVSSARDIALMSRALLRHSKITEYSSIWMDSIRDGAFGLTNTNRLIRFYKGATGLKTGSTAKAGFCISATAEREGMTLICVVMAAPTRDVRNATASSLLDWGFANYAKYTHAAGKVESLPVLGGTQSVCRVGYPSFCAVVPKTDLSKIEYVVDLPEALTAPIHQGESVGNVVYSVNGAELGKVEIIAEERVEKIGFFGVFVRILQAMSFFNN